MPAEKESLDSSMPLQLQLAHIAGDVKLILFQVGDISQRVDRHETVISTLQSQTQALKAAADASTEKAEALALALKEAKEAVEAHGPPGVQQGCCGCAGQDRQGCAGMVSGY